MRGHSSFDIREFVPQDLLGPLNSVERAYAPEKLYVLGNDGLLRSGRRVSVVGSRRASPDSLRRARRFAKSLVQRGVTVVSGLAAGIDTAAHTAAIENGGHTIAVLGTPVDVAYPRANRELHRRIALEHAAVSQFPVGASTQRRNFPMRNRTMALLSDATVIVAAGEDSGAVHQGWEALRLGRDLLLLESFANSGVSWAQDLLHYGAGVLNSRNLNRWLDALPERACLNDLQMAL